MEFIKGQAASSEEKLLQLIRKKNNPSVSSVQSAASSSPQAPGEGQPQNKETDFLTLTTRALAVMAVGIFIFILINFRSTKSPEIKMAVPAPEVSENIASEEASTEFAVRPFESYRQTMESRDVFQAPWEKSSPEAAASGTPASDLSKQLKLVGIVLDNDPKAIVEDLTTQQTLFLSRGERIGNGVIEEIREDKVIVSFAEEKVELVP